MKYIDISWPIAADITAYKDKSTVTITPTKTFEQHKVRESLLTLSSHTGTHIDAPAHFLKDGITTDKIPLDKMIGPCVVIDMTHCQKSISKRDLLLVNDQLNAAHIILFKTRNSMRSSTDRFDHEFIYLDHEAAQYLTTKNIKSVGIDYLGIERNQKEHETHIILLQANIIIIEGLRLAHVEPTHYFLYCLPLSVLALDGAPARAILIRS